MKLLLSSCGITNRSIADALFDLVGKKAADTSLIFIPTAANLEMGDKAWLIEDLVNLKNLGFKSLDILDIAAVDEKVWRPRLEQADILFFGGGNACYLMKQLNASGLTGALPGLLKDKVYAGISAGSMVTGKNLALKILHIVYEENLDEIKDMPGLGFVDFYFLPHLNVDYFPRAKEDLIKEIAKDIPQKIYALDDNSALKIIDGEVEVVSEGKWFSIN